MIRKVSGKLQTEISFGKRIFKGRQARRIKMLDVELRRYIDKFPEFDMELGKVIRKGSTFSDLYKIKISTNNVKAFYERQLEKLTTASKRQTWDNFWLKRGHLINSVMNTDCGIELRNKGQKIT